MAESSEMQIYLAKPSNGVTEVIASCPLSSTLAIEVVTCVDSCLTPSFLRFRLMADEDEGVVHEAETMADLIGFHLGTLDVPGRECCYVRFPKEGFHTLAQTPLRAVQLCDSVEGTVFALHDTCVFKSRGDGESLSFDNICQHKRLVIKRSEIMQLVANIPEIRSFFI